MTKPARISQADMMRALKSVKAAGFENARIIFKLEEGTIDIFLGGSNPPDTMDTSWDDA